MRILSIRTAIIYVFDVKYPFTIKWNDLKEMHSEITFCKNKNGKQYLTIKLLYVKVRPIIINVMHNDITKIKRSLKIEFLCNFSLTIFL